MRNGLRQKKKNKYDETYHRWRMRQGTKMLNDVDKLIFRWGINGRVVTGIRYRCKMRTESWGDSLSFHTHISTGLNLLLTRSRSSTLQNFVRVFILTPILLCFPPLPISFSSTPNRSAAYPPGYEYHRFGTTSTACNGDSFTLWRRSVLPVRYELDCKYCYK
jgi:hypothetical protein